jgi:hypothetical protein
MPRLENWSIVYTDSPFTAPELRVGRLEGIIFNDERERENLQGQPFEDGAKVVTSKIQNIDYENGTVQTRNTLYELGEINPDFVIYLRENDAMTEEIEVFINRNK